VDNIKLFSNAPDRPRKNESFGTEAKECGSEWTAALSNQIERSQSQSLLVDANKGLWKAPPS